MSSLDPRSLRDAFGRFMTGVTVVTTCAKNGQPAGFTANSFTSVSMNPPLLLVCPGKFLSSFDTFVDCDTFAISVLAEGQENISNTFASYKGDRFAKVPTHEDQNGMPLIHGAVATFSCKTHKVLEAGDHAILIGEVIAFEDQERPALGYQNGQYFSLGLERVAGNTTSAKTICGAIVQVLDTVLLEPTDTGYRPPQFTLPDKGNIQHNLSIFFSRQGIDAETGPVYSVFDDTASSTQFAYLLATAQAPKPENDNGRLHAIPISDLHKLEYTTEAIGTMMSRFAQEAQTRDFTLYLGDAVQGGTHRLRERR